MRKAFRRHVFTICHQIEGDRDDLRPDFNPQHVCEAPSGSKTPSISARSQAFEVDRDDLGPDFIPQHACEALAGSKNPVISARSR